MNHLDAISPATWDQVSEQYSLEIREDERQLSDEIRAMLQAAGILPGARLVELGCGSGHLSLLLAQAGYRVTLVDFSQKALDHAGELFRRSGLTAEFMLHDLLDPAAALQGHYDVAWNSGVMEHFSDAELARALANIRQISCDRFMFLVPNATSLPYLLFRQDMMARGLWIWGREYLRTDYPAFFAQSGFILADRVYMGGKTARNYIDELARRLYGQPGMDLERLMAEGIAAETEKYLVAYVLKAETGRPARDVESPSGGSTETITEEFDRQMSALHEWMKQMDKENRISTNSGLEDALQGDFGSDAGRPRLDAEIERLNERVELLNQEIDSKNGQLADAKRENDELIRKISEIKSKLEMKQLTVRKLESDKETLIRRLNEISNILSAMAATKPYQLSNLLRRFSHEVIHGNRIKRKDFAKWIGKKMLRRPNQSANPYNLISQICEENAALVGEVSSSRGSRQALGQGEIERDRLSDFEKRLYSDVSAILEAYPDPYVLVYPTAIDWHIELFQRPQHLARYISESGYLTLFITCNYLDKIDTVQTISPDCHILNANNHIDLLMRMIRKAGKKIILKVDSTDNLHGYEFIRIYEQSVERVVYDYIDEIHEQISGREIPQSTWERHRYMLENKNVVVIATADRLYQEVLAVRGPINCALVSNGADIDHFSATRGSGSPPAVIRNIVQKKRPVIGYYGALADWFDFELVKAAAKARPGYEFVLIGPVLNTELDRSQFLPYPNIHLPGAVNYRQLPGVAAWFDVATIPFKINEITLSTSPIKLFEYMALGKPIVTTAMPECRKYASVLVADDVEGYIRMLDDALARRGDSAYLALLAREAEENSWQQKAQDILRTVNRAMKPMMPVLFLSIIDWNFRFQRPQHIARSLAENGHDVFFVNANFAPALKCEPIQNRLSVLTLKSREKTSIHLIDRREQTEPLFDDILEQMKDRNLSELVIIVEYPTWAPIAERLKVEYGAHIIFDYLDEFEGFSQTNTNRFLAASSQELRKESDLIVATSSYLYDKVSKDNDNCIIVRNGTEFSHFNQIAGQGPASGALPEGQRRPVIGYYGAIADWFADRLVASVARTLPQYDFVLIGDYRHGDVSALKTLPNVRLLGEMPYEVLPEYLRDFDVCLIPFNADLDLIKATNPVKFYEYLSAGKKIVATEIPELAEFGGQYVLMSNDPVTFADMVRRCVDGTDGLRPMEDRIRFARQHDWTARAGAIEQAIVGLFPKASIIVVTYNNIAYTKLCLDSIVNKTTYPNYEVIVVDNASIDVTPQYLQIQESIHDTIRAVLHDENSGFAKGNNIGIREADGEIVILLNNDTIVTPGWIHNLQRHLMQPGMGLVGPVTNNIANEARIPVDYKDLKDIDGFSVRQYHDKLNCSFDIKVLAMYCVAMGRHTLDTVGLLDESFGIGMFEDDDYSERVRKAGLRVVCFEDIFIHHFGGATFKLIGQDQYMELFNKNRKVYEAKHNTRFKQHRTRE